MNFFRLFVLKMVYAKHLLAGKIDGGTPLLFFAKKVVRGNAVQISSNFPAKSLSIYRAIFFDDTFAIN